MLKTGTVQTVPREYGGKWVVWSGDVTSIVATGDTLEEARAAATRAGAKERVYQWVPPADERFIGSGA